ncbi:hypothetical protein Plhal703r1_c25g0105271 [Plasmopara halstedii]
MGKATFVAIGTASQNHGTYRSKAEKNVCKLPPWPRKVEGKSLAYEYSELFQHSGRCALMETICLKWCVGVTHHRNLAPESLSAFDTVMSSRELLVV